MDAAENLAMVAESVAFLKRNRKEVIVDCEHFFDGHAAAPPSPSPSPPPPRAPALRTSCSATPTARRCADGEAAIAEVLEALRQEGLHERCRVGTHAHNDTALAVANSLAGARRRAHGAGCVNGYGERTGNADVLAVAGNLELKMGLRCLPGGADAVPAHADRARGGRSVSSLWTRGRRTWGAARSRTKGLHVAALAKMPHEPQPRAAPLVGNEARAAVSELSGRGNIVAAAREAGRTVDPTVATLVLAQIKELEARGFVLEDAGATVEILFRRADPLYRAPSTCSSSTRRVKLVLRGVRRERRAERRGLGRRERRRRRVLLASSRRVQDGLGGGEPGG